MDLWASIFIFLPILIEFFILNNLQERERENGWCKDQISLESRTGMDPDPRSPNNKFIECRKES